MHGHLHHIHAANDIVDIDQEVKCTQWHHLITRTLRTQHHCIWSRCNGIPLIAIPDHAGGCRCDDKDARPPLRLVECPLDLLGGRALPAPINGGEAGRRPAVPVAAPVGGAVTGPSAKL